MHCWQWVKCPQMWSWKDCTSQNYRILLNSRLCWLCMTKKLLEKKGKPNCSFTIGDSCKTSYWSDYENSKLQGSERCCGTRISHQESKQERKPTLRWKWDSVFSGRHLDKVPKETHVVSVMTHKPLETVAKVRDEKDDRLLLHPIRRQNRLKARDKNPQRDQVKKGKLFGQEWNSMPIQILWKPVM